MENNYTKLYIIVCSILTILVVAVLQFCIPVRSSLPAVFAPLFYTAVSIATIKVMSRPQFATLLKFSNAVMLSNMGKMVVYVAYLLISYLNLDQVQKFPFVVVFMLLYVVFAVVDTNVLLRIFKKNDNQPK